MERIVEKGEIAHFEQFYLFPQCFHKAFLFKVLKCAYTEGHLQTMMTSDPCDKM